MKIILELSNTRAKAEGAAKAESGAKAEGVSERFLQISVISKSRILK
jgi:hypothetical protein